MRWKKAGLLFVVAVERYYVFITLGIPSRTNMPHGHPSIYCPGHSGCQIPFIGDPRKMLQSSQIRSSRFRRSLELPKRLTKRQCTNQDHFWMQIAGYLVHVVQWTSSFNIPLTTRKVLDVRDIDILHKDRMSCVVWVNVVWKSCRRASFSVLGIIVYGSPEWMRRNWDKCLVIYRIAMCEMDKANDWGQAGSDCRRK